MTDKTKTDDMVTVPREPTEEMDAAGRKHVAPGYQSMREAWKAMVEAWEQEGADNGG